MEFTVAVSAANEAQIVKYFKSPFRSAAFGSIQCTDVWSNTSAANKLTIIYGLT